jgi:hypothetical protein
LDYGLSLAVRIDAEFRDDAVYAAYVDVREKVYSPEIFKKPRHFVLRKRS